MNKLAFDIFISYSSLDKQIADAVKHGLHSAGIRCWMAPDDISPGKDWAAEVAEAIEACPVMVLIWTTASMASAEVPKELGLAMSSGTVVIPFRLENIQPQGSFKYHLAGRHWLDAYDTDLEDGVRRLVALAQANVRQLSSMGENNSVAVDAGQVTVGIGIAETYRRESFRASEVPKDEIQVASSSDINDSTSNLSSSHHEDPRIACLSNKITSHDPKDADFSAITTSGFSSDGNSLGGEASEPLADSFRETESIIQDIADSKSEVEEVGIATSLSPGGFANQKIQSTNKTVQSASSALNEGSLAVGDRAPLVALVDQYGIERRSDQLGGRCLILFFYIKDDTPGCVMEVCAFRDSYADLQDMDAEVWGVSGDDAASHQRFAKHHTLPFPLLVDSGDNLQKAFGVPRRWFGFAPGRVTYVIDGDGVIRHVCNDLLDGAAHRDAAIQALKALQKS